MNPENANERTVTKKEIRKVTAEEIEKSRNPQSATTFNLWVPNRKGRGLGIWNKRGVRKFFKTWQTGGLKNSWKFNSQRGVEEILFDALK